MCRMLAVMGSAELRRSALTAFHRLAEVGKVRPWEVPGHSEGWGIAAYPDDQPVYIVRSPAHAVQESASFVQAVNAVCAQPMRLVVAHLRKATHGTVCQENVHPFFSKEWLFAHNGTVLGLEHPSEDDRLGTTDSEMLLAQWHASKRTIEAYPQWVQELCGRCRHTSVTSILCDGRTLCAFRQLSGISLKPTPSDVTDIGAIQDAYYTLFIRTTPAGTVICSEILPELTGEWRPLANGEAVFLHLDDVVR